MAHTAGKLAFPMNNEFITPTHLNLKTRKKAAP